MFLTEMCISLPDHLNNFIPVRVLFDQNAYKKTNFT